MKKFILGCIMMLCGLIGGTGWLVAYSNIVQAGVWSTMLNLFPIIGFGRVDGYIVMLFYIVAIVGAFIAFKSLKEENK